MEKKKEEKILIILDNVWEEIDLKSIGIPEGGDNGKCKLLLTTRKRDVLVRMGSKVVEIGVLSEEESWRLFKNTIGDFTETSDKLKSLVNDICKKCGCLPIAIVTVAKALKNKRDLRDFEDALLQLNRSSSTNLTGPLKMAYLSIELSYNCLSGEELKRTFLLCSLMRHQCSILDLVKYVLGLDTFEAIYKIAEARNRVYTLINDLKDSGLLINDQTNESFSMHDFVREVALSIANRDNHVFSMRNEIEGEWPSCDRLKICKMIFIRDSTISELHEGLECPELESFFMNTKVGDSHVEIPENFFKGMTKLKVLELTRMQISSLQSSLHLLEYLQTLCLDYSNFEDVVIIGKLEKLKVLSLRGSNVKQLPEQIGQLSQLRLLDLRDCHELEVIAPNVISKLFRLEELYMRGCAVQWENKGILNFKSSKASLDELNHLPNLTTLDIYIKDSKIFPKCSSSRKLKRYNISIGKDDFNDCILCRFGKWDYKKLFDVHETLRMLKLIQRNSIIRSRELECFKNVEVLCIGYVKGVKNVLYELDNQGFSQLKHLHVHNNPNVSCIVDSTKNIAHDAFPNLEMLYLFNLSKLQNIFRGHPTTNSLGNLKIVLVESCNKLENIFSFSYARVLPKLEMMSVDDCKNLKEIFSNEREDNNNNSNEVLECSQLHHLTLKSLPQLTSICSEGKKPSTLQERQKDKLNDTLMPLFDIKVVFPNLEALELREINSEKIWDCQCSTLMSSDYKNLTRLNVWGCNKLKYVFPSSMVTSFEQLQCLEIFKCKSLKVIVDKGEREGEAAKFIFPRVTFLSLKWLPELEIFYPGEHTSEWPMLKELVVCYCDKVKIFNTKNSEGQLDISGQQPFFLFEKINPNLETLKLSEMECKMIWQGQFPHDHFCSLKALRVEHDDESTSVPLGIFQRFKFLEAEKHIGTASSMKTSLSGLQNLEVLQVDGCDKLINLACFSITFQNLTELKVKRCNRLINLVTSSTAKSLEQLRELKISACKMMIEVVENEGDGTGKDRTIVLKNLKFLSLKHLESFERFGNYKFNFPSLMELKVNNCRKMKTFCEGKVTAPNLRNIKKSKHNERYWKDDLNITIQQLHKESKGKERRHQMRSIMWITLAVIHLKLSWRIISVLFGTISIGIFHTGIHRRSEMPF
ncbi:disease resistance protein RPS2-like [Pistacia vera]|uniref:disease resistance protein RPS2-like n=1 Tax=Pistacia vera TaxID=55513 RepID=UPI001262DB74|nr:disease resistance protein RPS2-like [Pistacia vera]